MGKTVENEENSILEQVSFDPSPNTEFLREKIKAKPLNKKKLIRRTLINVMTAAIFGVVACLTFFLLEPYISERLNRTPSGEESVIEVNLSEVDDELQEIEEISPEDMYANDTEMIEEVLQGNVSEVNQNIQNIEAMVAGIQFDLNDYMKIYAQMRNLAESVSSSIVTVTGVISETTVFDDLQEPSGQISGIVIADNGPSLLILVKDVDFLEADDIQVRFWNGETSEGKIIGKDEDTNFMILSVNRSSLDAQTLEKAVPVTLGTSRSATLKGTPVIALGAPTGVSNSISYGIITASARPLDVTDADYTIINTDIPGMDNSSGIIVNLRGSVIGIIDNSFDEYSVDGMVNAIGITELRHLVEKMSNKASKATLGIKGTDITYDMREKLGLPAGIYLNAIEIDSPAMTAGLKYGDIVIAVNGKDIKNYHDLILWLSGAEPETDAKLTIMRKSVDNYVKLNINVTLGSKEYTQNID